MQDAKKAARAWTRQQTRQGRRRAAPVIALGAAGIVAAIGQSWCLASLLGAQLANSPASTAFLGAFAALALLRAALQLVADRRAFEAGAVGRSALRADIVGRLLDAGPALLRTRHSADLTSAAVDHVEAMDGLYARWVPAAALAMFGPVLVLAAVLSVDRMAALILLGAGLLVPFGQAVAGIGAAAASRNQHLAMSRLQTRFLDRIRGIATIVLAGRAGDEAASLAHAADDLRVRTMRVLRVVFLSSAILDCAAAIALVCLALRYRHDLLGHAGSPARALFVLLLVPEFFAPLRAFSAAYQDNMHATGAAESLVALPPRPVAPPALAIRTVEASGVAVSFQNVRVTWDAARGPALDGLSFVLPPGEMLVLAGPSGAGKSTVIELLLGFIRADEGRVLINGADIADIVPSALAALTAWIGQRPTLFATTIAENIRFARPDATEAEVHEAARQARVLDFTAILPAGLDTAIGEGGHGISGGQAQRVAIARAFLKNAPLLLLDEPTSHLDPATEAEVLASLRRLAVGRTVVMASHSAAAHAFGGRRLDLRQGRAVPARGLHDGGNFPRHGKAGAANMSALLRILSLWRPRYPGLAFGAVIAAATAAAGMALMALSGETVAAVLTGALVTAPLWLRIAGPARVILRYLERLVSHGATFRAIADLRVWFFRGFAARSAGGLGFRPAGDLLSRMVADIEALDGLYLRILLPLAAASFVVPAAALLSAREAGWVGFAVAALFAMAAFVLPLLVARDAMRTGVGLAEATGGLRIAALDTLAGLREVRAFGAEPRMQALIGAREAVLIGRQRDAAGRVARANAAAMLCGQCAIIAVLAARGVPPALQVACVFVVIAGFEAIAILPRSGVAAGVAAAAARRVLNVAEGDVALPDPENPKPMPAGSTLRFEGVGFRWAPGAPLVFDGLTLDIPAGAHVALLGPSGAGKSTLAALALKVVAPQGGRVLLGGTDLADLAADGVRHRIAWLGQTTHIFDDTIRGNLLLGLPAATETQLWRALDEAAIGDWVRALPEQLDTWLGEGGARVSGGQGRRIALARALLSAAPILILDEPCAGLDAETERAFFTTLNTAAAGRTVVLIAHRLTGVERLDRIWRLSSGRAISAAA